MRRVQFISTSLFLILLSICTTAHAEPIPGPVEEMIRAAGPDKIGTIADVAKMTNPNSVAEIDALVASIKSAAQAEEAQQLASRGFFEGWSGEGQIGGFQTTGNTKDTGIVVGVKLAGEGLHWDHAIEALADFQRTNGESTREAFRFGYKTNYNISDTWYAYGLLQWERDKFAGITRRFTESVGFGHVLFDNPMFSFKLDVGPALRQTRYVAVPPLPERSDGRITLQGTGTLEWTIRDGLHFTEEFGALAGSGNSTFYSHSALTAALNDVLSARLSFDLDHETSPPPGFFKTDTATRASLVYNF